MSIPLDCTHLKVAGFVCPGNLTQGCSELSTVASVCDVDKREGITTIALP